jgi:FkbM family methyltransferase
MIATFPGAHVTAVRARSDLQIAVDSTDLRLLEVFYESRSQNPEQSVLRTLLREGDSFIDVGANYGTFSLVAASIVGPSGRVVAIEPQPKLAGLIRKSAQLNGFANLEVENLAAGSGRSDGRIYVPRRDTGRAGLHPAFSARTRYDTLDARVERLDSAIDWRGLPGNLVMKIDVEGAERDVIRGASDLIDDRNPALIVELNPWSAGAAGYTVPELLDALKEKGYDCFVPVASFVGAGSEIVATDRQQNIVATHANTAVVSDRILTSYSRRIDPLSTCAE